MISYHCYSRGASTPTVWDTAKGSGLCAHLLSYKLIQSICLRLTALSTEYGFLLVADDTIGGFANLDLLHKPGVVG